MAGTQRKVERMSGALRLRSRPLFGRLVEASTLAAPAWFAVQTALAEAGRPPSWLHVASFCAVVGATLAVTARRMGIAPNE